MDQYQQTIDWLFNQIPMFQNIGTGAYKPGLETVTRLSDSFGSPHKHLRAIHIAGTNGKGSTASTIAAILTAAGYKTALYTSPHLVDFRERIRIDGQMIPQHEVTSFINKFRQLNFNPQPSFFELTTVMALQWFHRQNVDFAVIEVGLGGRLDATNIITPLASVITNISLDHTALLGNTPQQIAGEKAGIIKPGIPVIIGHAQGPVRETFLNKATQTGAPIYFAQDNPAYTTYQSDATHIIYKDTPWGDITSPLCGDCQVQNTNTILHTLSHLGIKIPANAVAKGFADVTKLSGLRGRWETIRQNPTVICDTGHNPGGWQYLGPRLKQIADTTNLHIIIGFVNDKDITSILSMMPQNATYYFTTPSVKRGRQADETARQAISAGLSGTTHDSVQHAYEAALANANQNDTIFVGGSTFIVADLLKSLQ